MQSFQVKTGSRGHGECTPLLALILLGTLLCGCGVWKLEKGIKQVGHGIEEAEGLGMEEAALYHLNVARSLVEAAQKQYEEADFRAAAQFLEQSESQLARARRLHALQRSAYPPPPPPGAIQGRGPLEAR